MTVHITMWNLNEMINKLYGMSQARPNDERQDRYCQYVTSLCSHYKHGNRTEQCKVVGSTKEGMRLRLDKDDGDFDYLVISWIQIPNYCLEYHQNLPCFVRVRGEPVLHAFEGSINLLPGGYLPSATLREVNKTAFPILKGILKVQTTYGLMRSRKTFVMSIRERVKPGLSMLTYRGWQCPELQGITRLRTADPAKINDIIIQSIKSCPDLIHVIRQLMPIAKLIIRLKPKKEGEPLPRMYQQLEHVITAFSEFDKIQMSDSESGGQGNLSYENGTSPESGKHVKSSDSERASKDRIQSTLQRVLTDGKVDRLEDIYFRYQNKASKDFIPAFQLEGPPECIALWCENENRIWPSREHRELIRRCKYYIIAKPSLQNTDVDKDFCLGFSEAELILSDTMLPIQKKSLLVIKAYQRCQLVDCNHVITSFHWKTALYRVSESDTRLYQDYADSPQNVLHFVGKVIKFMRTSVQERYLEHFFCKSNLFAGLDESISGTVVKRLDHLLHHPENGLRDFFVMIQDKNLKCEQLSMDKLTEITESLSDDAYTAEVSGILTFLSGVAMMQRKNNGPDLRDAVINVFQATIPYTRKGIKNPGLWFMVLLVQVLFPVIRPILRLILSVDFKEGRNILNNATFMLLFFCIIFFILKIYFL